MTEKLDVTVDAVDDPETAMTDVDIAATCTDARTTIVDEEWLSPGTFVTNVASPEMGESVYDSVDRVVTSHNNASYYFLIGDESDDEAFEDFFPGSFEERNYEPLAETVVGNGNGRESDDEIILFDNKHIGIQFAAVGSLVYEQAREQGLGMEIPLSWFQQNIRN
jgi:ornithine cyclodeaminase/alanine dehydrogenase-like protein (mu-crystallin family)